MREWSNTRELPMFRLIVIASFFIGLAACGGGGGAGAAGGGSSSGSGTSVVAPTSLSYSSPLSTIVGTALTAQTPSVTGTVSAYSVTPALPAGLSIDAATGVISGTPTTTTPTTTYTVTATNSAGSTSFALVLSVAAAGAIQISALSEITAETLSSLTITGTGFDPANAAISVVLQPESGAAALVVPAYAASPTSVQIMVPPLLDLTTKAFADGTVAVQVIEVNGTTVSASNVITGLAIAAPPAVPTGVGVGVLTVAFLTAGQNVANSVQSATSGNPALSALGTDLGIYEQDLSGLITAINSITSDPGQTVSLPTSNGVPFVLNAQVLALSDQLALAYVTQFDEQAGLVTGAPAASRVRKSGRPRAGATSSSCFNTGTSADADFCAFQQYGQDQATVGAQAVQNFAKLEAGLYLGVLGGWAIDGLAEGGVLLQESAEAAQLVWSAASSHIAAYATASQPPPVSDSLKDVLVEVVDKVALGGLGVLPAAVQADSIYEDAATVLESSAGVAPAGGLLLGNVHSDPPPATTPVDFYQVSAQGATMSSSSAQLAVATSAQSSTVAGATLQPSFTVSTSGSGTVTSSPPAIDCGTSCTTTVAAGTVVTLTATPASGNVFSGWSGGACSGTGACVITASANVSVTATFALATGSSAPSIALTGATCQTNETTFADTASFTMAVTGPEDALVEIPDSFTASCGAWQSVPAGNLYSSLAICQRTGASPSAASITMSTSNLLSTGTPFTYSQAFAVDTYSAATGVVQAAMINATAQCD